MARRQRDAEGARARNDFRPVRGGVRRPQGDYLFGDRPGVADFYLFVMLLWARRFGIELPASLAALRRRMAARPTVQAAMRHEGLLSLIENDIGIRVSEEKHYAQFG